jgi:hypothetical protein
MRLEDIQIALFDMYDLRTLLRAQRGVPLAPRESEETIGGCIDGVIQLLESLEDKFWKMLSEQKTQ